MARNNTIQIRRGEDIYAPTSGMVAGEPLFSTDNGKLYIATAATTKSWIAAPILDEDAMGSNSATSLATQQSIKQYVTDRIAEKDTLAELSDTAIASLATGHMLIYDGSDSFDNKPMSGDATINSSGVLTIGANAVEGSMINSNAAGDGLSYASSVLKVNVDDSSIETNSDTLRVKAAGITNAMLAGSIANAKLSNSTVTVSDGSATDAVSLGETLSVLGTANEVTTAVTGNTITIGLPDDVTIAGNLTVSGDTVTTNVATVTVEDPLVQYASGNTGNLVDIGFYGKYVVSSTTKYLGLAWDQTNSEFLLFDSLTQAPTTTVHGGGGANLANASLRMGTLNAATVDGGSY
jgi:hypothetical protein